MAMKMVMISKIWRNKIMKKIFKSLTIIAAAALTFASCEKNTIDESTTPEAKG